MSTVKQCDHRADCPVIKGRLACNVIPVWYQTTDGVIKGCTLGVLADKRLRPRGRGVEAEVERCTLVIPVDCTYTTEPVSLTPEQWLAESASYKLYQSQMYRRIYGYNGEGGS